MNTQAEFLSRNKKAETKHSKPIEWSLLWEQTHNHINTIRWFFVSISLDIRSFRMIKTSCIVRVYLESAIHSTTDSGTKEPVSDRAGAQSSASRWKKNLSSAKKCYIKYNAISNNLKNVSTLFPVFIICIIILFCSFNNPSSLARFFFFCWLSLSCA